MLPELQTLEIFIVPVILDREHVVWGKVQLVLRKNQYFSTMLVFC